MSFALNSSGPGPVKHAFKEAANGTVELGISATIVGTYSLSVRQACFRYCAWQRKFPY